MLRAWEHRYGLLRPVRSPGGFRLYTDEDAERARVVEFPVTKESRAGAEKEKDDNKQSKVAAHALANVGKLDESR